MTSLVFPVATSVFSRVCVVPRDCQATLALAHPTHSSVTWDGKHSLTHPHFHSENLVPSHKAPSGSLSVPLLIPTSTQFLVAPMLLGNKRPLHSTSVTETQKSPNSPQCEGIQVPPPGHITQPFLLYSLVWRNKGLSPLPGLPGEVSLLSAVWENARPPFADTSIGTYFLWNPPP